MLNAERVDLEQEDNAARLLEVNMEQDPKTGFLQKKLIKLVLETVVIDQACACGASLWRFQVQLCSWNDFYILLDTIVLTLPMPSTVLKDICSC